MTISFTFPAAVVRPAYFGACRDRGGGEASRVILLDVGPAGGVFRPVGIMGQTRFDNTIAASGGAFVFGVQLP